VRCSRVKTRHEPPLPPLAPVRPLRQRLAPPEGVSKIPPGQTKERSGRTFSSPGLTECACPGKRSDFLPVWSDFLARKSDFSLMKSDWWLRASSVRTRLTG
jgi:hypothetical protein